MKTLDFEDILSAARRIDGLVKKTPILCSSLLNQALGHDFYFKAECLQTTGAFKVRGALNTLLWLKENGNLPNKVVAYSSGNHAQAVAWAAKEMGISAHIFMPKNVSGVKLSATKSYGAKVTLCEGRQPAEDGAHEEEKKGAFLLPPFDHDQVICGQGTACLEALEEIKTPLNAVAAPCGGGGLLSGTYIAAKGHSPNIKVLGAEPTVANDAVRTLRDGKIFRWQDSPNTLADGAKTLSLTERTYSYVKNLDELYEVSEKEISYWTQVLHHFLKVTCEPTSAMSMAAAIKWAETQNGRMKFLIILSGGNISRETITAIWQDDHLSAFTKKFLN